MPTLQEIDHTFRDILMVEEPQISKRYGIPGFLARLDRLAAKTAQVGELTSEMQQKMLALQQEATSILQAMVDNDEEDALALLPGSLGIRRYSPASSGKASRTRSLLPTLKQIEWLFRKQLMTERNSYTRRYGVTWFLKKLDHLAARKAQVGKFTAEMKQERRALQQEGIAILQAMIDEPATWVRMSMPWYLKWLPRREPEGASPFDWEIWWLDTFDSDSDICARGSGILNGLYELWENVLYGSVGEDGRASFNRYRLIWEYETGKQTTINVDLNPVGPTNPVLAKLNTWVFPPGSEEFRARIKKEGCSSREWPGRNDRILWRLAEWHLALLQHSERWGKPYHAGREADRILEAIAGMQGPDELLSRDAPVVE